MRALADALSLPARAVDWRPIIRSLCDLTARAVIIVLFSTMAARFALGFMETGRITPLLLLASEALVVVLTLVRRSAVIVDRSVRARLLTLISVLGPPLLSPGAGLSLAPQTVTVGISIVGLLVIIAGKATLGRSFALLPANRGIVSTGLYGIVRHPIYMGYLVTHVGFLLASPSLFNVAALLVADVALLARAVCEEETLALDPEYRDYQQRVRWRVAPGLF